jgi:hypothetical protein
MEECNMPQLDTDFHDGTLQGFWRGGDTFHLLLATREGAEYALLLHEVIAVSSTGFSIQNIIFDVQVKESHELTEQDMRDVYAISAGDSRLAGLLEKAQARRSVLVVVDPSCGANCLALGQSVELLLWDVWTSRFLFPVNRS